MSPRQIMTGQVCDYKLHCQLQFGEYARVHESHDNSMATRTTGALALWPTGNLQGGYYFISLATGKRLNRNMWTALPMPNDVIERTNFLAANNPAKGEIEFCWRSGDLIEDEPDDLDDIHDEDYVPGDDSGTDSDSEGDHPVPDGGVDAGDADDNDSDDDDADDENMPGLVDDSDSDDDDDDMPALVNKQPDDSDSGSDSDSNQASGSGSDSDKPPSLLTRGNNPNDSSDDDSDDEDDDDEAY